MVETNKKNSESAIEISQVGQPQQTEMPFAIVMGKEITELPKDLYIPPMALEVFLEAFEGPLDLLLYLIRRQNLDVLEINVALITEQYMAYIELMDAMQFELAAEYLLMASVLAEIKSRMLLPRSIDEVEDDDPRANLIKRLQEYQQFKRAAENLDELPRMERDNWLGGAELPTLKQSIPKPNVDMRELVIVFGQVLKRANLQQSHRIQREALSTRERMSFVLEVLKEKEFIPFVDLFSPEEGRAGVVVTFLALMELMKDSLIEIVQTKNFGEIHVRVRLN